MRTLTLFSCRAITLAAGGENFPGGRCYAILASWGRKRKKLWAGNKKGVEYITKFSPGKAEHEDRPVSHWFFADTGGRFKLTLTSGFLALEDSHYTSLSPYLEVIQSVMNSFSKGYESVEYTRIGLRYINNITVPNGDPLDWSDYISDSLTCPISNFVVEKRELSRAMSQFVLNKGDCSIMCNFGIFNGEFPAKISRKEFILDFDCFSNDVEADAIPAQLKRFNLLILEVFEKSIKEKLRKSMGAKRV